MDQPELAENERYATHSARGKHQAELDALINDWSREHSLAVLEEKLERHGIPCGLIFTAREMLDNTHFKDREAIVEVEHPELGPIKMQNIAPRLSDTPGEICHVGPALGEHNDYVYSNILGIPEDKKKQFYECGII